MSLVCAFAWDYNSLLWFRTLQGIGLGGEVPVAATYISELTRAKNRGRFVLLYELVFPIGLVAVSLTSLWVVPTSRLAMDVLHRRPARAPCAGPARAAAGIAALARRARPQRRGGRRAVADRKRDAEGHRAAVAAGAAGGRDDATSARRCPTCSGRIYLRRTLVVWVIWFAAYFINYGLVIWLTTIFRTVYKLPLDVSLRYGLIIQVAGFVGTFICALTIDHVGRRPYFAVSFAAAAVSLGLLAMQPTPSAEQVLMYVAAAYFFISTINIGAYLYTPELYPTRSRALGVGTATAWLRFASMIGPTAVGFMIGGGLQSVFWMFATAALDRRRHHRRFRDRDEGPRAGGGVAVTAASCPGQDSQNITPPGTPLRACRG